MQKLRSFLGAEVEDEEGETRRSMDEKDTKRKSVKSTLKALTSRLSYKGKKNSEEEERKRESIRVKKTYETGIEGKNTSQLYCWGHDSYFDNEISKTRFSGKKIINVAAGSSCAFVVTADGAVFGVGSNDEGQIEWSRGVEDFMERPLRIEEGIFQNKQIKQVAVGASHSAFLSLEGYVITYGRNDYGQLGHSRDREPYRVPPRIVQKLGREVAVEVACSDYSTFILTSKGKVFSFGLGENGVLGLGDTVNRSEPKPVGGLLDGNPIKKIVAGPEHCLAISVTGFVFGWGSNQYGQLGVDTEYQPLRSPIRVSLGGIVKTAACGPQHSLFLTIAGEVIGCGLSSMGQLGFVHNSKPCPPRVLTGFDGKKNVAEQIAAGDFHSTILLNTGELFCLGGDFSDGPSEQLLPPEGSQVFRIFSHGNTVYALTSDDETNVKDRRKSYKKKIESQNIMGVSTEDLNARYKSLMSATEDKRKSKRLQVLKQHLGVTLFDMNVLNASFLKRNLGCEPGKSRIELKRNSCVDVPGMVEALDGFYHATLAALGPEKTKLYFRQQISFAAAQMDEVAPHATEPDQLRAYLIMLLLPFSHVFREDYKIIVHNIERLPKRSRDILFNWVKYDVPSNIFCNNLVHPLIALLDNMATHFNLNKSCEFICRLLSYCFKINQSRRKSSKYGYESIRPTEFYSERLAALRDEDLNRLFERWRAILSARKTLREVERAFVRQVDPALERAAKEFTVFDYPFLLSADLKRKVLQIEDHQSMFRNLLFSQLFRDSPYFVLEVGRETLLQDTINCLASADSQQFKKPLRVKFRGEDGLDAGGVKKEFFQLLSAQLFSPEYGMFAEYEATNTLWFRNYPAGVEPDPTEFLIVGELIGLAMYNSTLLDVNFPLLMYRILLDKMPKAPGLDELTELDPSYAKNLAAMMEYNEDDFEDIFCTSFEVTREVYGEKQTIQLKPGGSDISVTKENREEYVALLCKYLLLDSVKPFMEPLVRGFQLVIPPNLASLSLFEPNELELAATGTPDLDFDELQMVTTYEGGFTRDHPTIKRFWKVAKSLSNEQKQQFMSFSTGSPKAPVGGLKTITFKIQRAGPDSERLVSSSTCFNTLLLPDYSSEEKLRSKLLSSIEHNQGFGNA